MIKKVFEAFGFGSTFKKCIKTIYISPSAAVTVNSLHSKFFPLQKGTRQGCAQSPLLLALAIESLVTEVRNTVSIKGVCTTPTVQKVSYTDDIPLTLINPEVYMLKFRKSRREHSPIAGYKINQN